MGGCTWNGDVSVTSFIDQGKQRFAVSFCSCGISGAIQAGANMIMERNDAETLRDMLDAALSVQAEQREVA